MKFSNEFRKKMFDRLDSVEFLIHNLKSLVQNEMPIIEKDIEEYSKVNNKILSELSEIKGSISSEFEKEEINSKRIDNNSDAKYMQFKLKDISNLDEVFKVIDIMEQNNNMEDIQININNEIDIPLRVNHIRQLDDNIEGNVIQQFKECIIHKDNELKIGEASIDFKLKL